MKSLTYILVFILSILSIKAQNLSYGIVFGADIYITSNNNGTTTFSTPDDGISAGYLIGSYLEYNFNKNLGLKTEINFNTKKATYRQINPLFTADYKFTLLEICPNFKYDFGKEYRKGFYLIAGPKLSFITNAKDLDSSNFNKTLFGLQFGFGGRVEDYVDLQLKFCHDLTPFFIIEERNNLSNFSGINLSLNLDLERIIKK